MIDFNVDIIHINITDSQVGLPYRGVTGKAIYVESENAEVLSFARNYEDVEKYEMMDSNVLHLSVNGDVEDFKVKLTLGIQDYLSNLE